MEPRSKLFICWTAIFWEICPWERNWSFFNKRKHEIWWWNFTACNTLFVLTNRCFHTLMSWVFLSGLEGPWVVLWDSGRRWLVESVFPPGGRLPREEQRSHQRWRSKNNFGSTKVTIVHFCFVVIRKEITIPKARPEAIRFPLSHWFEYEVAFGKYGVVVLKESCDTCWNKYGFLLA